MQNQAELISTTELNRRLGVSVTAKRLIELGCKPFYAEGPNHWWDEDDYLDICEALSNFILNGGEYLK